MNFNFIIFIIMISPPFVKIFLIECLVYRLIAINLDKGIFGENFLIILMLWNHPSLESSRIIAWQL